MRLNSFVLTCVDGVKGRSIAVAGPPPGIRQAGAPSTPAAANPEWGGFTFEGLVRFEEAQLSRLCVGAPRACGRDGGRLPRGP